MARQAVPFELIQAIATEYGASQCCWRESERSFTGFVAEIWFKTLPSEFARGWAGVVGYAIRVRRYPNGPAKFMVSVPCTIEPTDLVEIRRWA